jgi:hypothetical protein
VRKGAGGEEWTHCTEYSWCIQNLEVIDRKDWNKGRLIKRRLWFSFCSIISAIRERERERKR